MTRRNALCLLLMGALFLMRTKALRPKLILSNNTIVGKNTLMHPISELLCEAYAELHTRGQVSFPLHEKQRHAIDSVVKTVNATYFGFDRFSTVEEKAVAYLCLIIKAHAVTDGNKRLALLWFKVYCAVNHLKPNSSPFTLDQIAVTIEREKEMRMPEIMKAIQEILFRK